MNRREFIAGVAAAAVVGPVAVDAVQGSDMILYLDYETDSFALFVEMQKYIDEVISKSMHIPVEYLMEAKNGKGQTSGAAARDQSRCGLQIRYRESSQDRGDGGLHRTGREVSCT